MFLFSAMVVVILSACGNEESSDSLSQGAAKGKQLFRVHCASCHSTIGETVIVGPSLAGVATLAETREEGLTAEQYLFTSVLKPDLYLVEGFDSLMPTNFGVKLAGEELDNLVVYLLTLTE